MSAITGLWSRVRPLIKRHTSAAFRARLRAYLDRIPWRPAAGQNVYNDRSLERFKFHLLHYRGDASLRGLSLPRIEYLDPVFEPAIDVPIAARLLEAYVAATRDWGQQLGADGVWKDRPATALSALIVHLERRNPFALAQLLCRMFRTPLTDGMGMGLRELEAVHDWEEPYALVWHDRSLALAEACGLLPVECPEAGPFGGVLRHDSRAVYGLLWQTLGETLAFPEIGGCYGVRTAGGLVPLNFLQHVYAAHRMRQLAGGPGWSALEIGGGFGGLALASAQLGAATYTIADLPLVNVLQGYFLLRSPMAGRVRLYGEGALEPGQLHIVPGGSVRGLPDGLCDLVVNQDSLPEMGRDTAIEYLQHAGRLARRYVLSLNQEHQAWGLDFVRQLWVSDLARQLPETPLQPLYRAPSWMRAGYVEEVYLPPPKSSPTSSPT